MKSITVEHKPGRKTAHTNENGSAKQKKQGTVLERVVINYYGETNESMRSLI